MIDKNGNITINYDTWKNGIGSHPTVGMGDIVNVDIFSRPGVAKIDYAPTKILNSEDPTDTDTLYYGACSIREDGDAIIGTEEGDVFIVSKETSNAVESESASSGDYISSVYWKGYVIFVDYSAGTETIGLSAYQQGSGGDDIETDFVTGTTDRASTNNTGRVNKNFPIIVGIDDVLYVGYGNLVASLQEKANETFDPGDSGTYTWNAEALDIPSDYVVDGLENLGNFLIVSGATSDRNLASLFPWDRVSASYNFPTVLNDGVAAQMISYNNLLYLLSGTKGKVIVTNRSISETYTKFDNINFPLQDIGIEQKSNNTGVIDDVLLFGISNDNKNENFVSPVGVYKVKDGKFTRCTLSSDNTGEDEKITIHFVEPFKNSNFLVGWQNVDTEDYGVDEFGFNGYRYTGYKAKLESPLATVAGAMNKRSYQQLEVKLAKELSEDQGIKIYYRENLTDDWSEIAEFSYATYGAEAEFNTTAKISDVTTVQIKVELTTGSSSTTTPELISVNIM